MASAILEKVLKIYLAVAGLQTPLQMSKNDFTKGHNRGEIHISPKQIKGPIMYTIQFFLKDQITLCDTKVWQRRMTSMTAQMPILN